MRFLEASGPFDLAPGQAASIVVAYVYAAPVTDGACPGGAASCYRPMGVTRRRLTILGDPTRMVQGNSNSVNQIDRMTGYLDFTNGGPADTASDGGPTKVTQDEFVVRRGSLLGKATVAQTVFNNRFLLPVLARAAAVLPGPRRQPGHRSVVQVGDRDGARPVLCDRLSAQEPGRHCQRPVRSELPRHSTSRDTGSIAVAPAIRAS